MEGAHKELIIAACLQIQILIEVNYGTTSVALKKIPLLHGVV